MAVTRSSAQERRATAPAATLARARVSRTTELAGLLLSSLLIIAGVYLVLQAKTAQRGDISKTINLNAMERREQLLPVLTGIAPSSRDRLALAAKIFERTQDAPMANVGTLARGALLNPVQLAQLKSHFIVRTPAQFQT